MGTVAFPNEDYYKRAMKAVRYVEGLLKNNVAVQGGLSVPVNPTNCVTVKITGAIDDGLYPAVYVLLNDDGDWVEMEDCWAYGVNEETFVVDMRYKGVNKDYHPTDKKMKVECWGSGGGGDVNVFPARITVAGSTSLTVQPIEWSVSAWADTSDAAIPDVHHLQFVGSNWTPNVGDRCLVWLSNSIYYAMPFGAADATNPGWVSTTSQTFAGYKTFDGGLEAEAQSDPTSRTILYPFDGIAVEYNADTSVTNPRGFQFYDRTVDSDEPISLISTGRSLLTSYGNAIPNVPGPVTLNSIIQDRTDSDASLEVRGQAPIGDIRGGEIIVNAGKFILETSETWITHNIDSALSAITLGFRWVGSVGTYGDTNWLHAGFIYDLIEITDPVAALIGVRMPSVVAHQYYGYYGLADPGVDWFAGYSTPILQIAANSPDYGVGFVFGGGILKEQEGNIGDTLVYKSVPGAAIDGPCWSRLPIGTVNQVLTCDGVGTVYWATGSGIGGPAGPAGKDGVDGKDGILSVDSGTPSDVYGILCADGSEITFGRTLTAPAAGFTITNPDGVAGDPTFALADDLAAVEGLATNGLVARTAADTWTTQTIVGPAEGIAITDGDGIAGDPTFALANDLAAVEGLTGVGFAVRTTDDVWAVRTITGVDGSIGVTNGDGVAGDIDLAVNPANLLFVGAVILFPTYTSPPTAAWIPCNGDEVSRTTYAALYAVIGDSFGPGDGSTTFDLPNLTAPTDFNYIIKAL
jgi:hypothetical protein